MNKRFYIISTFILIIILILMLIIKVTPVLSLEDYVNIKSVDPSKELVLNEGPQIEFSRVVEENIEHTDGNVKFEFTVHNDELIRSCTLYHNINQPFRPDSKQINTFVQVDYPITFTLENVPDGNYKWGVVCEDRLFRKNYLDEISFIVKKSPPESLDIPDIEIKEDGLFILNLSEYFSDSNDPYLTYEAIDYLEEIKIKIDQITGLAYIEPNKNWFGTTETKFVALNKLSLETESNSIKIVVSQEGDTPPRFVSQVAQGIDEEGVDEDGYLFLECNVTDDYNVKEVSLYSDTSGEWKLEETREINSIDSSINFELKDIPNGQYSWACSSKDNLDNETISQKQEIEVKIKIKLENEIPSFMVNNIETMRSVDVAFSKYLDKDINLSRLSLIKPNSQIYYEADFSKAKRVDIDTPKRPKEVVYIQDIKINPEIIFEGEFYIGNKIDLEIILDYTFKGQKRTESIFKTIEIVKRPRSSS